MRDTLSGLLDPQVQLNLCLGSFPPQTLRRSHLPAFSTSWSLSSLNYFQPSPVCILCICVKYRRNSIKHPHTTSSAFLHSGPIRGRERTILALEGCCPAQHYTTGTGYSSRGSSNTFSYQTTIVGPAHCQPCRLSCQGQLGAIWSLESTGLHNAWPCPQVNCVSLPTGVPKSVKCPECCYLGESKD